MGARRPAMVLGAIAVTFGAGAFAWNVLLKQPNAHPAPLFAGAKPAAVAVEPPRRPVDLAAAPPAAPRAEPAATRADAARPAGTDPIASILRTGDIAPKPPAEAKPARAADAAARPATEPKSEQARVTQAQKALSKLGYGPIATDGKFGSTTRQALEKFERDRKLPVTGALGPRTSKQLAAFSGLPVP